MTLNTFVRTNTHPNPQYAFSLTTYVATEEMAEYLAGALQTAAADFEKQRQAAVLNEAYRENTRRDAIAYDHRTAIKAAFKAIRKQGIAVTVSIQSCCASCAELPNSAKGKGYVWQIASRWRAPFEYSGWGYRGEVSDTLSSDLYLYWGHDTVTGDEELEVAKVATETLRKFGLTVEWDGTKSDAICVKAVPVKVDTYDAALAA